VLCECAGQAESARGFVDGAESLDPDVVLGDAATAQQAGGPVVARARKVEQTLAPLAR
jgi:hypothetical protein